MNLVKILVMTICFFSAITLSAENMKTYFLHLPTSLDYTLNRTKRLNLAKKKEQKKEAITQNNLGGISELITLNKSYFKLKTSEVGSLEGKLLPINDTTQIIAIIKTIATPIKDSQLSFYTTTWEKIDYPQPLFSTTNFLCKKEDNSCFDMLFFYYSFFPNNTSLKIEIPTQYLKQHPNIKEHLVKNKIYFIWKEKRFIQDKH